MPNPQRHIGFKFFLKIDVPLIMPYYSVFY